MYSVMIERVMQYIRCVIIERVMQYEITPITPNTSYTGNTLAEDLALVGNTFVTLCCIYLLSSLGLFSCVRLRVLPPPGFWKVEAGDF